MENLLVQIGIYAAIALAVVELAKRVAEVIPGKRDDEIVSGVERFIRTVIDLAAGRNLGKSGDPSAIIRTQK